MPLFKYWKTGLLLLVLSFAFYGRALQYEFVWDDERAHLTEHEKFMSGNLKELWTPHGFFYIPVSYTVWYGIKKISEDKKGSIKPFAFHFSNILLHAMNSFLVFFILMLLIKNRNAAFFGSLLFLMHPLQVESVVWISEFRGLLAAFFAFLSLIFFWKELEKSNSAPQVRNATGFLISTLLFLLAVLSKPSVIILPFILVVLTWFFHPQKIKTCINSLALWLPVVIPISILTGASPAPELKYVLVSPWLNLFIASYSVGFYFLKILFPAGLSPCYGFTPVDVMNTLWPYTAMLICLVAAYLMFRYRNRHPVIIAGILIMLMAILPVSGLRSFDYQRFSVVADRYVYFGMAGIALAVSQLWLTGNRAKWLRYTLIAFMFFFVIQNIRQVPVWKNEFSLWNAAYQRNPKQWTANFNLGVHYMKQGQTQKAVEHYSAAILANPYEKTALVNRANALARLNQFEASLADYAAALALDEKDGSIFYNRALTYYKMDELSKCLNDLEEAKKRNFPVDESIVYSIKKQLKKRGENGLPDNHTRSVHDRHGG